MKGGGGKRGRRRSDAQAEGRGKERKGQCERADLPLGSATQLNFGPFFSLSLTVSVLSLSLHLTTHRVPVRPSPSKSHPKPPPNRSGCRAQTLAGLSAVGQGRLHACSPLQGPGAADTFTTASRPAAKQERSKRRRERER